MPLFEQESQTISRLSRFHFDKMASVMEQNSENLSPEELKENKDRELEKHKKNENNNRRPSSGASISSSYSKSSSSSESEPRKKKKKTKILLLLQRTCAQLASRLATLSQVNASLRK